MKIRLLFFCIILPFLQLNAQEKVVTDRIINEDILFSPEFEAYKYGRKNDSNGVGKSWFERFRIIHMTDAHQCNENIAEVLQVAGPRGHAVINTGDDANGVRSSDALKVKEELDSSMSMIYEYNTLPYLQVPGNHDVTGLTKREYFERVGSVVRHFSPSIIWGDKEGFRSYGYIDFIDGSYEGKFRVILLDPFDYEDGMFESRYEFISAVFSQKQIDWLIRTLKDAAEKGLNVITAMHYSFGDCPVFNEDRANPDANFCQDPFMIPDIIDAIQKGKKINKKYKDSAGIHDITIHENFSDVPELEFVVHLFGHVHSKNHFRCQKEKGKKYDILMLGESSLGISGTALNKTHVEKGTIAGIAFSALEIDVVEKAIYRVSYGACTNYDKSDSARTVKIPYRFTH